MTESPVYSPVPHEVRRRVDRTARPKNLDGLTVGLIGNLKPNADVLLTEVGELLRQHGAANVVFREKLSCSLGAPITTLDGLAKECDIALAAMGDCGSCTTWTVNDAVEMEKRNVPALAFVASPYLVLAKYELESVGMPDLSVVEIKRYPFGNLPEADVKEQAKLLLAQVEENLTTTNSPA